MVPGLWYSAMTMKTFLAHVMENSEILHEFTEKCILNQAAQKEYFRLFYELNMISLSLFQFLHIHNYHSEILVC
jgi:hypothetical protein